MGALSISVLESPHLQGTILALRGMDKVLAAQIRKATKDISVPEWRKQLAAEASTPLERKVLVGSARVSTTSTNVSLKSGQLNTKMTGGARLFQLTGGTEFGATQRRIESVSSKGKRYSRRRGSQFRRHNAKGYVVHPAAAEIIPRIASLWVATTVRTFHEAIEKGVR